MFVTYVLSRLHTEVEEDLHNIVPMNFLQHLNTIHMYYNYGHFAYTLYKHKAKH